MRIERFRLPSILLFYILLSTSLKAQLIDTTLNKYANNYSQEKAYIHFDKATYYPGETIWFKAYLMEGVLPAESSKTFYIDWVSDNGNVLYHTVSPLVDGITNGQFDIPATFTGNYIHVRAYTKWMLNFDTAFYYNKDIRIIGKSTAVTKSSRPSAIASIQFFPEGGEAVDGVPNRVAFKANDQWGKPVRIRGIIQSAKGVFVDSLRTLHDGMGSFLFIPQAATSYVAKWKDEKGAEHTTDLPSIKSSGISVQVTVSGSKRFIKLNSSANAGDNLRLLHLIGTMNQHIVFKTDANLPPGENVQKIVPTANLPSGLLIITVFDAGWNAVAERITFVNNHEYAFMPSMEVQHWGLSKRARNEVQIKIPDSIQVANLSVSVTDGAIERDTSDNIISHLLLTADLKGYVYNPTWYFQQTDEVSSQLLDLVMLTNGWRRFKWEDVAKGKYPIIHYPRDTSYLSLSGQVFGVSKSQINSADNIILLIKNKDSSTKMVVMSLNTKGEFNDPTMVFFDTLHIYYHLKSKYFSNAEAKFMTERLPPANYSGKSLFRGDLLNYDTTGFYHHAQMASEALRFQEQLKSKVLETVTVRAKTKSPVQILDDKYTSGLFKSSDSYNFDLINDPLSNSYPNILYYLTGKVAGLQINASSTPPSLSWRGSSPTLFLDEVQSDVEMVNSIPVSDVAYVKVIRPPFVGAIGGGAGGAIAIYTRRGNDVQNKPGQGLSTASVAGYTPLRQFYSPNYDRFDPRNEQPDVRTTLYWSPTITIDPKTHLGRITFYNNDLTKYFHVTIEGMTKDGLLTHFEETME